MCVKGPTFAVDQHVWLYWPRPLVRQKNKKWTQIWTGPWKITQFVSPLVVSDTNLLVAALRPVVGCWPSTADTVARCRWSPSDVRQQPLSTTRRRHRTLTLDLEPRRTAPITVDDALLPGTSPTCSSYSPRQIRLVKRVSRDIVVETELAVKSESAPEYFGISSSKTPYSIANQGHWKWYHSIDWF